MLLLISVFSKILIFGYQLWMPELHFKAMEEKLKFVLQMQIQISCDILHPFC